MPHIAITMLPGRSREIKQDLAMKVRELVARELKINKGVVSVSIEDIPLEQWDRSMERVEPGNMITFAE